MLPEQAEIRQKLNQVITIFTSSSGSIRPHHIVTGPSGSGKSHVIQEIAQSFKIGFLEINAAQLTKEGNSGNSLSKALVPLQHLQGKPAICFVDEFDKLFISGNTNDSLAPETTNGVQNEFLRLLESSTTQVIGKYGHYDTISIAQVLFIFAGAFNGEENITLDRLRHFGIKTEFLGRVGLVYNMKKLSIESMYEALKSSKLFNDYLTLYPGADRGHAENAIMTAVAANYENNTLGLRLLFSYVNQYFINGGKLTVEQAVATSFQTTLNFNIES